jgi:two-component system, sensor histidine kinase and response regulator
LGVHPMSFTSESLVSAISATSILVVDDNEINCEMLRMRLVQRGYSCSFVTESSRALDVLASEEYDLVLLDIMMPGISGMELLGKIRERYSLTDLPVIMATARDQSSDIVEAFRLGANDYVTKPIDFSVLTARLETQLQLRSLSRQKDEFVGIASHDLKNPLSVIRGYARVLKMIVGSSEPDAPERMLQMLERIDAQTATMERIINDFLDFNAIENGRVRLELRRQNLNDVVARVIENLRSYARDKHIELRFEPSDCSCDAMLDETRIEQVVQNLVGNAIKFSDPQTRVVACTLLADDGVRFEVSDNGPGITGEDMSKLFVKYARLSNQPTGSEKSSGLGLAICKQLVDMHGGSIGASANPGGGTIFWFSLPCCS